MKAFIVYSFSDLERLKVNELALLQEKCPSLEIVLINDEHIHWKSFAYSKIREANCAVYFLGKNSYSSKNINWELKRILRRGVPLYVVKLDEDNKYNELLINKKPFANYGNADKTEILHCSEKKLDELCFILNNNLEVDLDKELYSDTNNNYEMIIEQYKVYLQTSEDLVARRQTVSNFYISVNSVIVSIFSAIVAVVSTVEISNAALIILIAGIMASVIGVILCRNWSRILESYGKLNSAKMTVISAIEKKLPFNIYDVEWKVQTDRLVSKKYISFTRIERKLPIIFGVIYICILVISIAIAVSVYFVG